MPGCLNRRLRFGNGIQMFNAQFSMLKVQLPLFNVFCLNMRNRQNQSFGWLGGVGELPNCRVPLVSLISFTHISL
jgi:hypothetical protein